MPVDLTSPAEINFECRQGSPFHYVLQFFQDEAATLPVDWTGYEINMNIREGVADSGAPVVMRLSSSDSSDADARIFFPPVASDGNPDLDGAEDRTSGCVYLRLLSSETDDLRTEKPPKKRTYPVTAQFFCDIEATPPGGEPFALAYGAFDVTLEVTRPT